MQNFSEEKNIDQQLASKIEVSKTQPCPCDYDTQDSDIEGHIACFLEAVGQTLKLSNSDISSAEDSKKALAMINELRQQVQAHRHTAQALKQLLISDYHAAPPAQTTGSTLGQQFLV
jgi:hypothetical protein